MSLAIYIHIPYCIQKCRFCDFTTFTKDQMPQPEVYVNWLRQEIDNRHSGIGIRNLSSIYFGGGTPSLISEQLINNIIEHLKKYFKFNSDIEISIEINPGTITKKKLHTYLQAGVNRFSVGVQTFRDDLLKLFHREHSAQHTHQTLDILSRNKVILSCDLLFALNHQSLIDLEEDLNAVLSYSPHHISAYYMTLPNYHPLQKNRPQEPIQMKMFQLINSHLKKDGFYKYEISNFARPGFESRHNKTYWLDKPYWGIGLSAHSFFKVNGKRIRFWNPKTLDLYQKQVKYKSIPFPFSHLPLLQKETLKPHEALTDFCHTALRTCWGIKEQELRSQFGDSVANLAIHQLQKLQQKGYLQKTGVHWVLKSKFHPISNTIFQQMTFLKEDFKEIHKEA